MSVHQKNAMIDTSELPRQLLHWGGHTTVCATPSFVLAIMAGFRAPAHIAAMLLGIATMILLYALISSLPSFCGCPEGSLSKAARYGARTRSAMCVLELPLMFVVAPGAWIIMMPDLLAGMAALHVVGLGTALDVSGSSSPASFAQIYAATVIEACLVSGAIFAVFAGCILTFRALVRLMNRQPRVLMKEVS